MKSALLASFLAVAALPLSSQAVTIAPLSAAIGVGNVATSPTTAEVYGPSLDTITRSGINIFGEAFTNTASSRIEAGNPTAEVSGTAGAVAQAALVFSYRIDGPEDELVPVMLTGTVSVSVTGSPGAYAEAFVSPADGFMPLDPMLAVCASTSGRPDCASDTQTMTGTVSYSVLANVEHTVYLHAIIDASGARSGTFHALADPSIVVDPAFARAGLYSVAYSPGVAPAVPEPATWASMVLGLGALMAARRSRVG